MRRWITASPLPRFPFKDAKPLHVFVLHVDSDSGMALLCMYRDVVTRRSEGEGRK